jgi:hypothetical protein
MDDDLDRRAGKPPEPMHPFDKGTTDDPADHADPRVAQPGEDPEGEDAMEPIPDDRIGS